LLFTSDATGYCSVASTLGNFVLWLQTMRVHHWYAIGEVFPALG